MLRPTISSRSLGLVHISRLCMFYLCFQVSLNYVNRVRLLNEEQQPPQASPVKERPSTRVDKPPRRSHKSARSPHDVRRGPAHEASHLRTRSPRHPPRARHEDHIPLQHTQAGPLHQQFKVRGKVQSIEASGVT